jgi:hypothetical protein
MVRDLLPSILLCPRSILNCTRCSLHWRPTLYTKRSLFFSCKKKRSAGQKMLTGCFFFPMGQSVHLHCIDDRVSSCKTSLTPIVPFWSYSWRVSFSSFLSWDQGGGESRVTRHDVVSQADFSCSMTHCSGIDNSWCIRGCVQCQQASPHLHGM